MMSPQRRLKATWEPARTGALRPFVLAAGIAVFGWFLGLWASDGLADEPRLVLEVTERQAILRLTTVPPETVSEYPLPSQLLWEYQRAPNPRKCYVRYWTTPAGVNILRDAPADHLHHHGLMFAVGVDDVDFWAEDPNSGIQHDRGVVQSGTLMATTAEGRHRWGAWVRHELQWHSPAAQPLLHELRELRWISQAEPSAGRPFRMILWKSELSLPPGKESAKLWGRPYFGLGVRFIEAMDQSGEFINADGQTGVDATNGARASWCAYRVNAGTHPITVAMLDWPGNPRHPATWFTMVSPFSYLSATLGLHQQPIELRAGEKLVLVYGVVLWDEIIPAEVITQFFHEEFRPEAEALAHGEASSNQ